MMKIQPPPPPENIWVTRAGCSVLLVWIGLVTIGLVGMGWGHDYPSPANEEWRNFPKVHVRDDLRLGNSNITPATLNIISDGDGTIDNADGQHSHLSIISSSTNTALVVARWRIEPGTNEAYCRLHRSDWQLAGAWLTINGREFDLNDGSIARPDSDPGYTPDVGDRLGTHGGIHLVMDKDFLEADAIRRAELGQPDFIVATLIYGLQEPTLPDAGLMFWPSMLSAGTSPVTIWEPMTTWSAQTLGVGPY